MPLYMTELKPFKITNRILRHQRCRICLLNLVEKEGMSVCESCISRERSQPEPIGRPRYGRQT